MSKGRNYIIPVVFIVGFLRAMPMADSMISDDVPNNLNDNSIDGTATPHNDTYQVNFNLFSPGNENDWIPISINNSTDYLKRLFHPDMLTRFIVHGWLGGEDSVIVNHTAVEYRRKQISNVVKVDWSYRAGSLFYPLAAMQTVTVGSVIAALINKLVSIEAVNLKELHLIGHSLGAHIMGNAGSMIIGKPARITGLDPAGPGFEGIAPDHCRLDSSDANFVDVIHSAGLGAGFYNPLGHADFYPNGGSFPQPGCFDIFSPMSLSCSHARSYYYYIESITNRNGFVAVQCNSWKEFQNGTCKNHTKTVMGDATPPTARGTFYLETNSASPYAKG